MWAVKGRFAQALKDDDPVFWVASSDNKFTLSVLAVSILFQSQIFIFNLTIYQEGINLSDSAADVVSATSSTIKSVAPGVSISVTDSASEKAPFAKGSIQDLIATELDIPAHLCDRTRGDLRMAYAKYMALTNAIATLSKMTIAGTWIHKYTNDDVIEVFMSKSMYFRNHSKVFPMLNRYPAMEQWLENAADAPADSTVWGHERQSFDNLKKILKAHAEPSTVVSKKGKEKEVYPDEPSSSPIPVEKKKAGVKKGKKKEQKGKQKAGSSKGHHARNQ